MRMDFARSRGHHVKAMFVWCACVCRTLALAAEERAENAQAETSSVKQALVRVVPDVLLNNDGLARSS